jgi:chitosanase
LAARLDSDARAIPTPAEGYYFEKRKNIKINPEPTKMLYFVNANGEIINGKNKRLHLKERWTGSISLKYRLLFSSDFEWGSGGILPGIIGGKWWCTPRHGSSQCWRVQLGWGKNGDIQVISRIPQAKRSIPRVNKMSFEKDRWHDVSMYIRVNTGESSNGEVEIWVDGKRLAIDSNVLFSVKNTRSVYMMMSGKYIDKNTIPKVSERGEIEYILTEDFSVDQVRKVFASPPPPPPSPPPPSPPPPIIPSPPPEVPQDPEQWIPEIPAPVEQSPDPWNPPVLPPPTGPYVWEELTPDQYRRTLQLTSIFENSKLEYQYGFCKNIGDGRGYTFGFCGFTTKHADSKRVIQEYLALKPDDLLMEYYLEQMRIKIPGSDGTENLVGFCEHVATLGDDASFRQAQQTIQKSLYYEPSKVWSQKIGARHALTKGQMYDAMINHGQGLRDQFSIDHIVEKTRIALGGYPLDGVDEVTWLDQFLTIRAQTIKDLENWQTKRIDFYRELLHEGNLNLDGPIYVTTEKIGNGWTINNVYFGRFEIYNLNDGEYSII